MKKSIILFFILSMIVVSSSFAQSTTYLCKDINPDSKSHFLVSLSEKNNNLLANVVEESNTRSYVIAQNIPVKKNVYEDAITLTSLYFNLAYSDMKHTESLEGFVRNRQKVAKIVYCQRN